MGRHGGGFDFGLGDGPPANAQCYEDCEGGGSPPPPPPPCVPFYLDPYDDCRNTYLTYFIVTHDHDPAPLQGSMEIEVFGAMAGDFGFAGFLNDCRRFTDIGTNVGYVFPIDDIAFRFIKAAAREDLTGYPARVNAYEDDHGGCQIISGDDHLGYTFITRDRYGSTQGTVMFNGTVGHIRVVVAAGVVLP